MFPGSLLVRYEDGAQLNCKNAKEVAADVQAGNWWTDGRSYQRVGGAVKTTGPDRVEGGNNEIIITVGSIGCSVLGRHRCQE